MQGKRYKHRNGNIYTVLLLTNVDSPPERQDKYPTTVVYEGENNKVWSRRLSDWDRSFTEEGNEKNMKYLGDGAYAEFVGHGVWLCANHHENRVLFLELPSVLNALNEFVKEQQAKKPNP